MGRIVNGSASGDPMGLVMAVGFTSVDDALKFVQQGFKGVEAQLRAELSIGDYVPITKNLTVVFYVVGVDGNPNTLLSITSICASDSTISAKIISKGWQFYLVHPDWKSLPPY